MEIFSEKNIEEAKKRQKSPSRILLEFEVAQSQWEYEHGYYTVYKSVDEFVKHIKDS